MDMHRAYNRPRQCYESPSSYMRMNRSDMYNGNSKCNNMNNCNMNKRDGDCDCNMNRRENDCGCDCNMNRRENDCGCDMNRRENDCGCDMNRRDDDCGCDMNRRDDDCDCNRSRRDDDCGHKSHHSVGMAYVPMQEWCELYEPCEALTEGTAFPSLNLIFCGVRGK